MYTKIKTSEEISAMRESGKMLATVLKKLANEIEPSMSSKDLSEIAKIELKKLGGQPTFLGYNGFPDVLCISINDEVVHGIPSNSKLLNKGDLVSMDFGVTYRGMITDSAISVILGGSVDNKIQKLLTTTRESLYAGIDAVKDGVKIGDISSAIQNVLDKGKFGIIRELVGHGVGHELHEEPNIANYGNKDTGSFLQAGMTIAIEPMASLGSYNVKTDSDNWTIRTVDGSFAAHFEHTVLVTQDGVEILTEL